MIVPCIIRVDVALWAIGSGIALVLVGAAAASSSNTVGSHLAAAVIVAVVEIIAAVGVRSLSLVATVGSTAFAIFVRMARVVVVMTSSTTSAARSGGAHLGVVAIGKNGRGGKEGWILAMMGR